MQNVLRYLFLIISFGFLCIATSFADENKLNFPASIASSEVSDEFLDDSKINEYFSSQIISGELQNKKNISETYLDFNGTTSRIETGLTSISTPITISVWANLSIGGEQRLISGIADPNGFGTGSDYDGFMLKVDDQKLVGVIYGLDAGAQLTYYTSNDSMQPGVWNHYVFVYESGNPNSGLYVNGEKISSTKGGNGDISNGYAMNIPIGIGSGVIENISTGARVYNGYSNGQVSTAKIFNKAFTENEVEELHEAKIYPVGSLIRSWDLEDGSGLTATESVLGNNGTITDATWITDVDIKSRTTSIDLLSATSSGLNSFKHTVAKKPGGTNARVQFSSSYDPQRENVLSFDGSGDYVEVPDDDSLDFGTGDFTISLWAKGTFASHGSGWNIIIAKGKLTDAGSYSIGYTQDHKLRFLLGGGETNNSGEVLLSGEYKHIAVVRSGGVSNIYVDGDLRNTVASSRTASNTEPLYIGKDGHGNGRNITGSVSGVRLYSRGLSASEILDLYHDNTVDDTNLEGYWKLDEGTGTNSTDSSSNSNDGTITGATWQADTDFAHKISNWKNKDGVVIDDVGAYEFDGVDDYIDVGDPAIIDTDATFSIWFNSQSSHYGYLFSSRGVSSAQGYIAYVNANNEILFGVDGGLTLVQMDGDINPNDGKWHHFAGVVNGTSIIMYVDGVLQSNSRTKTGAVTTPANIRFGEQTLNAGSNHFDGYLSDFRAYSEALSASDIWNLYAYSIEPDDTKLEAHYKMNGNALDSSGNDNNGTVNGAINITDWTQLPQLGHSLISETEVEVASFDGVDDYVEVPNNSSLDIAGDITVASWVKFKEVDSVQVLISKYGNQDRGWEIVLVSDGTIGLDGRGGCGTYQSSGRSQKIDDDQWHYVVGTRVGGTFNIYVDGVLENSGGNCSGSFVTTEKMVFGKDRGGNEFRGQISNIAIYNKARTATEIAVDFENGFIDTSDANLVSYYPLAGDYNDHKGSNNGTASGLTEPTFIKDLYRPASLSPTEQTIDISDLDASSKFYYRTLFESPTDRTIAIDKVSVTSELFPVVEVEDNDAFTFSGDFSVEATINPTSVSGEHGVVSKWNEEVGIEWRISQENAKVKIELKDSAGLVGAITNSDVLSVGVTTIVAGSYNSTTKEVKIYINNVEVGIASLNSGSFVGLVNTNSKLLIGQHINSGKAKKSFEGSISNVKLYSSLDRTVVNEVASFLMNEGSGSSVFNTESTGSGVIKGATWLTLAQPSAPVIVSPANGAILNNNDLEISGTAAGNTLIRLYVDGIFVSPAVVASSLGAWTINPTVDLSEGLRVLTVTADNGAESDASDPLSVTIDDTAPAISISSPTDGYKTTDTTPKFTFTVDSEAVSVEVHEGGSRIGDATKINSTTWEYEASFSDDDYLVKGVATDVAGNNGDSNEVNITVDTTAPTPQITFTPNAISTNVSPVGVEIDFGEDVTGFIESELVVTGATLSAFSGSGSTYTATLTPPSLTTDSLISVSVSANVAKDIVNLDNTSASKSITYDVTDPVKPSITSPADGDATEDRTPTLVIDAGESVSSVSVHNSSGALLGSATNSGGNIWEYTISTLAVGSTTSYKVKTIDSAANESEFSDLKTIEVLQGTITGKVFRDDNKNGVDDSETGIENVEVSLFDKDSNFLAKATTDTDGLYSFNELDVDNGGDNFYPYTLQVTDSPVEFLNGTHTLSTAHPTTLDGHSKSEGGYLVNLSSTDNTADFGYFIGATIGDYVWYDFNRDGIQGSDEQGVSGVEVYLQPTGSTELPFTGQDKIQTVTDGSGFYEFDGLVPGTYDLEFVTPSGNYKFTADRVGRAAATVEAQIELSLFDSDVDEVEKRLDGRFIGYVRDVEIIGGGREPTIDAGMFILHSHIPNTVLEPALVGDTAFYDLNANDINDSEDGTPGVKVELYKSGVLLAQSITDSVGHYEFGGLEAGEYKLKFIKDDAYGFSLKDQTSDDTDSDADVATGESVSFNLLAGDENNDFDVGVKLSAPFALSDTVSIGDLAWFDSVEDGIQAGDLTETGVPGVIVRLYKPAVVSTDPDIFISKAVTENDGKFDFSNLAPDTYYLQYILPSGFDFTVLKATTDDKDSDVHELSGKTELITLAAGESTEDYDAGLKLGTAGFASLGEFVFLDANSNGIRDAGETGLAGVKVELYNSDNIKFGETISTAEASGVRNYEFLNNIFPGTYYVKITPLANYSITFKDQGVDDEIDSDISQDSFRDELNQLRYKSDLFTVELGGNKFDLDVGFYESGSIGNLIYYDFNEDGSFDTNDGDVGLKDVEVTLYHDVDADGQVSETDVLLKTATTNASGIYNFTDLALNSELDSFMNYVVQVTDSGNVLSNFEGGAVGDPIGTAAMLTPSVKLDNSIDFSYTAKPGVVRGYFWDDINGDGIQGNDENPIVGGAVRIYLASNNSKLGETITDEYGRYELSAPVGEYYLVFSKQSSWSFTLQNVGSDDLVDSDVSTSGKSGNFLIEFDDNGTVADLSDDIQVVIPPIDAGINYDPVTVGTIGNRVWFDTDRNGVQDSGEIGVSGVLVKLLLGDDTEVRSTRTSGNGNYYFYGVEPGDYKIEFDLESSNYEFTPRDQGGDSLDSDADITTGKTDVFTVFPGVSNYTFDAGVDFGLIDPSGVNGFVWFDASLEGIQNVGEQGLVGVEVELVRVSDDQVVKTTVPNNSGVYSFSNIYPNTYYVRFIPQINLLFSPANNLNTTDALDSDANQVSGKSHEFITLSGVTTTGIDAGLRIGFGEVASLSGIIFEDLNYNGLQDSGEPGVGGIAVDLYTSQGVFLATTTTSVTASRASISSVGNYFFNNLIPGDYYVEAHLPDETYVYSPQNSGDDTLDSDVNTVTGRTSVVTLSSGANTANVDAGVTRASAAGCPALDFDADGIVNTFDLDSDGDGILDSVEGNIDTDLDGLPDYLDTDSDGDGIPDLFEAQANAYNYPSGVDDDKNGVDNVFDPGLTPLDFDGDSIPDYLDLDSDSDEVNDNFEMQNAEVYIPPFGADSDCDGLDDAYDSDSSGTDFDGSYDDDSTGEFDYREIPGECSTENLIPTSFEMDGLGVALLKNVKNSLKIRNKSSLCDSISSKQKKSKYAKASDFYSNIWTNSWSIPVQNFRCTESLTTCSDVSTSDVVSVNNKMSRKMYKLTKSILKSCKNDRRIKRVKRKAKNFYRTMKKATADLPNPIVSCS